MACNDTVLVSIVESQEVSVAIHLTGLLPFTVYECTVSATTNGGMGNASDLSTARTVEDG